MRLIFLFSIVILTVACQGNDRYAHYRIKAEAHKELKGKVRWIKEGNYSLTIFDERGNATYTKLTSYHGSGIFDTVVVMREVLKKYDQYDSMVEETGITNGYIKYTYGYDAHHDPVASYEYDANDSMVHQVHAIYQYVNGYKCMLIRIDSNKIVPRKTVRFDSQGHLVERILFTENGRCHEKELMTYRDSRLAEKTTHYYDGDSTKENYDDYKKETYKYDDAGNKIEYAEFGMKDSLRFKDIYTYKDNLLMLETYSGFAPDHSLISERTEYKYNNKGMLVEKYEDHGPDYKKRSVYANFDEHGNYLTETVMCITKKEDHTDNISNYTIHREIDYYR